MPGEPDVRRSCRNYKETPVPASMLEDLVQNRHYRSFQHQLSDVDLYTMSDRPAVLSFGYEIESSALNA
ncbi:MAG: hypothetical protein R2860_02745 [Desulfobacterales bacterium]